MIYDDSVMTSSSHKVSKLYAIVECLAGKTVFEMTHTVPNGMLNAAEMIYVSLISQKKMATAIHRRHRLAYVKL